MMNNYKKVPYTARSDWLKQSALSENRARVYDVKLAFKFSLYNFFFFLLDIPCDLDKRTVNEPFVSNFEKRHFIIWLCLTRTGLPNPRIWLAEMDIDSGLDFANWTDI